MQNQSGHLFVLYLGAKRGLISRRLIKICTSKWPQRRQKISFKNREGALSSISVRFLPSVHELCAGLQREFGMNVLAGQLQMNGKKRQTWIIDIDRVESEAPREEIQRELETFKEGVKIWI